MTQQLEVRPAPDRTETRRPPPPTRRGRWLTRIVVLVVLGLIGLAAWWFLGRAPAPRGREAGGPPQTVGVATIATGDIGVVLTGLGAVTPLATVTVITQINGQLQQIAFTEGQLVHKGDFLAQIDPRPYQVALEQAQGTFAHDSAVLAQARLDNARYQTLNRQDSIARQQAEDQALIVKQDEGTVINDQGAIDSAKLNLTYCHITSPVDGRVGIRLVDPGNYVQTSSTTGLFVLVQLQPISVIFTLPEDDVDQLQTQMAAGTLQVTAFDRSDKTLIATGTLATIDNEIDNTTGTVKLRAMFPNPDNKLFPQQFVNAHLLVQTLKGVVVAPQAAIQHGAPGDFVYLVKPDGTVAIQVVHAGITEGDRVQINDGLKPGDKVVTDGLDRLRDGAKIVAAPPPGSGRASGTPPASPASGQDASGQAASGQDAADQGATGQPPNGAPRAHRHGPQPGGASSSP